METETLILITPDTYALLINIARCADKLSDNINEFETLEYSRENLEALDTLLMEWKRKHPEQRHGPIF